MKKVLSIVLSICMLFSLTAGMDFSAFALDSSGQCGENITYTFNSSTGELIISGTGNMYPYDGIADLSPFHYCSGIKSLVISDGVTSISSAAFRYCDQLTSINIPDSITSIGEEAFRSTGYYYNSANWDNNVLYIGNHLIKAKESAVFKDYTVKSGTKTIADEAFSQCLKLTSIIIPDSVTNIGTLAFYNSSLNKVIISDSVKNIGLNAFKSCDGLKDVYYTSMESNWKSINIREGNGCLTNAAIHYNYVPSGDVNTPDSTPSTTPVAEEKKANTLTVKAKTATVKYSKLKKKNQSVAVKNVLTVSKAKGTVSYEKKSGNKKITVNKKTGKVTVKKGLKKGTYKIKVKVSAAGNSTYKSGSKTVTFKIKVK